MENEVKEVVYLAISTILLSVVLGIASFAMALNGDMADIRNSQVQSARQILEYKEYNKYDRDTVVGDDVIECIRLYYDTGLDIFVDSRKNIDSSSVVNDTLNTNCPLCDEHYDHRTYNLVQYLNHKNDVSKNYFKVATASTSKPKDDLRNWFPTTSKYRAYCVYNSESCLDEYNRILDKFIDEYLIPSPAVVDPDDPSIILTPAKMKITKAQIPEALDACVKQRPTGGQVTGIIFINVETYMNLYNAYMP